MPDQNDSLFSTLLRKATSIDAPAKESLPHKMWTGGWQKLMEMLGSERVAPWLNSNPMIEPDKPFLKQYLHPEKNVFPPQTLRPTGLSRVPNIPFRKFGPITDAENLEVWKNADGEITIQPRDSGDVVGLESGRIEDAGLGNYARSIGKDEKGNPYLSIYDVWDMKSPQVSPLAGKFLDSFVGQPYAVYDRYPLEGPFGPTDSGNYVYNFKKDKP